MPPPLKTMSDTETKTHPIPPVEPATISEETPSNEVAANEPEETAAKVEEPERTPIGDRLYVGNIDFRADEAKFKEFLNEQGIAHVSVELPFKLMTRGKKKTFSKYLGFGFIQFGSDEDANAAIDKLNGTAFNSRFIYVKRAMPPATAEEKLQKTEAYFAKRREQKKQEKAKKREKLAAEKAEAEAARAQGEKPETHEEKVPEKKTNKKKPQAKKGEHTANGTTEGPDAHANGTTGKPEEKSVDTVYLSNVDYHTSVETLGDLLSSYELAYSSIHIPKRTVSPLLFKALQKKKTPILNRGIAFVKMADHETQLKAILLLNGLPYLGRTLGAEVAVNTEKKKSTAKASAANANEPAAESPGETLTSGEPTGESAESETGPETGSETGSEPASGAENAPALASEPEV